MSGLAEKLSYIYMPPTKSADEPAYQVLQTATGAAAASYDWVGALGAAAPKGKVWLEVEPLTQDVYLRFGPTSTTATTTTTGAHLSSALDLGTVKFYVDPVKHRYIDHIAPGGAGTLKVRVCSPIGERRDV